MKRRLDIYADMAAKLGFLRKPSNTICDAGYDIECRHTSRRRSRAQYDSLPDELAVQFSALLLAYDVHTWLDI